MKLPKFNKKLFLLRLIVFPFWFALVLIKAAYDTIALSLRFLIGGGELVAMYHDRKTIADIYAKVSELVEEKNKELTNRLADLGCKNDN